MRRAHLRARIAHEIDRVIPGRTPHLTARQDGVTGSKAPPWNLRDHLYTKRRKASKAVVSRRQGQLEARGRAQTMPALAREIIADLATWLLERSFVLRSDAAYATLGRDHLERTTVVSQMRRDAALYEPPSPRTGKTGRPRKHGRRLRAPVELANAASDFTKVKLHWRGRRVTKLVYTRDALWYHVCPDALVRLVVVRNPAGKQRDDFFFTTDLAMSTPTKLRKSTVYPVHSFLVSNMANSLLWK